ncbi:MAG: SMC-Scp complex subunit ScpB [Pseudomonadota bacterium]
MSVDIKRILEALIFVSEGPLSLAQMGQILETEDKELVAAALQELLAEYQGLERAFTLVEVAGGYAFRTRPELAFWLRRLRREQVTRLSRAALETLAIIAYKQPILKAEIERVRGVEVGGVLRMLMEKDLVRVVGRKDLPGRPLVYGTSKRFLEVFDLKDLSDLPTLEEMEALAGQPDSAEVAAEDDLFSRAAGLADLEELEPEDGQDSEDSEDALAGREAPDPGDDAPAQEPQPEEATPSPPPVPADPAPRETPAGVEADPLGWAGPEPAPPRLRPVVKHDPDEGDDEPPQAA